MSIEINQSALPNSLDAEQTVLGTIIIDSTSMSGVAALLRPEHFHVGLHSQLFKVMYGMFVGNSPIDLVTVIESSVRERVFDNQDEARGYLLKLAESVVNPSGIEDYARIIAEKHMLRSLMYACRDIYDMVVAGTDKPQQIMEVAEKMIYDLRSEREVGGLDLIHPIIEERLRVIQEACANPGARPEGSLSTSYADLDRYIFGLNPAALIIIAGRPAMGKTSFALNMAVGTAKKHPDKAVAVFSLEMSREELVTRMISTETLVTTEQMREGQLDNENWANISTGVGTLSKLRIYVDDSSNPSIGEMKAKLRRVDNLGLVVIDYLQLITTGRRIDNRVQEVSEITRTLKLLAKDLNVPVVVASQLSRDSAKAGKRPALTDLRDSGSIEQDADIVMFLHREHYYNPEFDKPYLCECIIAKHRQGETGTVNLHWDKRYTRFTTLDLHRSGDSSNEQ
ncbi:MAG: replicative DNA helicase [Oscillospiraceae bacterium]|nr:replicative DNA helicase [Oscillospiraceae bacterium]